MGKRNALEVARREHPDKTTDTLVSVSHWLPDAEELEKLEKLYPGITKEIVERTLRSNEILANGMLEESRNRHQNVRWGLVSSLVFTAMCLSITAYSVYLDHPAVACVTGGATLVQGLLAFTGKVVKPTTSR